MHIIQQPAFKLPRFANDQWINTESIYFLKSLRIFKLQNNKLLDWEDYQLSTEVS